MPPVIAIAAGAGLIAGASTGLYITVFGLTLGASFFGGLGATLVLGGISSAIRKKPDSRSSLFNAQARNVTVRQAAPPRRVIYGQRRVGGFVSFLNTRGPDNLIVDMVITLAGHEVEEIGEMYFDGEAVPLTESAGVFSGAGKWVGSVIVQKNFGGDAQAAFSELITVSPDIWTADHRQRGCAGCYVSMDFFNRDLFPNGSIPNITFDVKGKKVYDPRITQTAWSENPALIAADYLTSTRYGLGVPYATGIDEDALIAAANICDEVLEIDQEVPPNTEFRYHLNGMFDFEEDWSEVLQQMAAAMAGYIVRIGGKWNIFPGAFRVPYLTLTDSDFVAPLNVQTKRTARELVNGVKGTFIDPNKDEQQTDFPAVSDPAYVAEDGGAKIWKDISLPLTRTATACQRIAKIELERKRRQVVVEAVCKLRAYELVPTDVVRVTHSRFGWSEKTFEVADTRLTIIRDAAGNPALAIALVLVESDVDVYGFAVDEYGQIVEPELLNLQPRRLPFGWSPGMVKHPNSTAATLRPITDYSFGIAQRYREAADGSAQAQLQLAGAIPLNNFSEAIRPPHARAGATASTGGFIKGDRTVYIAVCARDANGKYSILSERITIIVPAGADTNTVTISGLVWDVNNDGWILFFGTDPQRLSRQVEYSGSLPPQVTVTGPDAAPTSITFLGFNVPGSLPNGYYEHFLGAPDELAIRLRFVVTRAIHLGIWGGEVDEVIGTTEIKLLVSPAFTVNALAGRYVSLVGLLDTGLELAVGGGIPLADFLIESNTGDTLTLAAGQSDPSAFGFAPGAVVVIRTKITAVGSDAGGNYIEDAGFGEGGQDLGDSDPNFGGGDGSLSGMALRIIAGSGAGTEAVIADNIVASKRIYIHGDWTAIPDTTSTFIVTEAHPILERTTDDFRAAAFNVFISVRLDVSNLQGDQYLVEAFAKAVNGSEASGNPSREIYLYGGTGGGLGGVKQIAFESF